MTNVITDVQIANAATVAGWQGQDLVTAVAVALAESGGDVDAVGDVALQTAKWGPSIGLWQVRTLKAEYGKGTDRDEKHLREGGSVGQAYSAYRIWVAGDRSWRPWSTYLTGAYRLYLGRAGKAAGARTVNADGTVTGLQSPDLVTSPLAAARNGLLLLAHAARWIADPGNWLRVGLGAAGAGLMVGGLLVVARPAVESEIRSLRPT